MRPRRIARRAFAYVVSRDGVLSCVGAPAEISARAKAAGLARASPYRQRSPEANRSEAPGPGMGTRHGSTAMMSRTASSRRFAPRVSTSALFSIEARVAKANSTHHEAASGTRKKPAKVRIWASVFPRKVSLSSIAAPIQSRLPRAKARNRPAARRAAGGNTVTLAGKVIETAGSDDSSAPCVRNEGNAAVDCQQQEECNTYESDPVAPGHHQCARRVPTGTSPITSVRSPMRCPGEHGARRVDHGAVAVRGDSELGQARFDAAERRRGLVHFRTQWVVSEPGIVRHGQDCLRAQPGAIDGEACIHVIEADQRHHRDLAAIGKTQREHTCACAGLPGAGPRQPAPQRRSVEPGGHVLGEQEETSLAVEAQQARAGHYECGRVVFAVRVAIVGPEHDRYRGGVNHPEDLAVEFGAGLTLGMTECGGIHRLRPQYRVNVLPCDGVVGHREVRVEHLADDRVGALLLTLAFVVHDVGLNQSHAQRLAGGRGSG